MAPTMSPLGKVVTEKEIKSGRISLPARVRDHLFPRAPEKSKTYARMVDEKGHSYDVVLKVREKRTKSEFMAKGGKKFAHNRNLKPGDVLIFSRGKSSDHFRVEVHRWLRLAPPRPPVASAVGFHGFSGRSSPPGPTVLSVGSDHAKLLPLAAPPKRLMSLPMAISSTCGTLGRIKTEEQDVGLKLELSLRPPTALFHDKSAVKLRSSLASNMVQEHTPPPITPVQGPPQDQQDLTFSAKAGSPKLLEPEPILNPPEPLFLAPQAAHAKEASLEVAHDVQERKPPTPLAQGAPVARLVVEHAVGFECSVAKTTSGAWDGTGQLRHAAHTKIFGVFMMS